VPDSAGSRKYRVCWMMVTTVTTSEWVGLHLHVGGGGWSVGMTFFLRVGHMHDFQDLHGRCW
jgi:hypothetical protein